jgi:hypothetical protein
MPPRDLLQAFQLGQRIGVIVDPDVDERPLLVAVDEHELVSAGAGSRGRGTPVGAGSGAGSRKRHSG